MNRKRNFMIATIVTIVAIAVLAIFLFILNFQVRYIKTFENADVPMFYNMTPSHYKWDKFSNKIFDIFSSDNYDGMVLKDGNIYRYNNIETNILEVFNEKILIKLPGKILSTLKDYVIYESKPYNILIIIPGFIPNEERKLSVQTNATKIIGELVCYNEKTYEIYVYDKTNGKLIKTIKNNKPIIVNEQIPQFPLIDVECAYFDGESIINVVDQNKRLNLEPIKLNKDVFLFPTDQYFTYILSDGSKASCVSLRKEPIQPWEKPFVWEKPFKNMSKKGFVSYKTLYFPTHDGIIVINSRNGDSKVIVEGEGWEMLDFSYYGTDDTGFEVLYTRKNKGINEFVMLLAAKGTCRVITFDPLIGEIRGVLRKYERLANSSVFIFMNDGVYKTDLPLFWGTKL